MEQGGPTRPSDEGAPSEPSAPAATPQRTVGQPIDATQVPASPLPLAQQIPPTSQETIGNAQTAGSSVRSFFGYVSTAITFLVLAAAWYFIGGLPFGDHDEYGKIRVGGSAGDRAEQTTIALPEEEVTSTTRRPVSLTAKAPKHRLGSK
jgi:hypothetical protein